MKCSLLLAITVAACGDNSQVCGPGTYALDGVCLPTPPADGGTDGGTHVDLEEAAEPNGFEVGAHSAGDIALPAIGGQFVVHGCIVPAGDAPDFDAYTITVGAPALIEVTAQGVGGLAAGFVTLGSDPQLATWRRFGVDTTSDSSHRELYLPKSGTYQLAVADTRSLLAMIQDAVIPPAGNPDGSSCYYVTLKPEAIPAPQHLQVPVGTSDDIADKVLFFEGPLPNGVIYIQESVFSAYAAPAFTIAISDQLRVVDDKGEKIFAGVKATDTNLIALDTLYNYAPSPVPFAVSFGAATTALPLPTANTTVMDTSKNQVGIKYITTNQFYFDASADGALLGMNIASTKPLQGVVWDADLNVVSQFGGFTPVQPFTSYTGLWRAPKPGRYYLAVIDPVDPNNTPISITSTVTELAATPIVVGTPLTAQAANGVNSNPYTVDLTDQTWDLFGATNTAVSLFDPATAFGRLDPLGGQPPDPAPLLSFDSISHGYIVAGRPALLVKANPHGAFGVSIAPRVATTLASQSQTYNGETGDPHRYFLPARSGSAVTLSTSAGILEQLNPDESVATPAAVVPPSDYIAFSVRSAPTYNLAVSVTPAYYSFHPSSTAFVDACLTGTHVPLFAVSDPISIAGFTFYGAAVSTFVISSNGYLSFHTDDGGGSTPHTLPDGEGDADIAVAWQALTNTTVCIAASGTKLTIQWIADQGRAQAILDTADDSIEFVYGQNTFSAIAGVQSLTGGEATQTGNGNLAPFKLTHP